MYGWSLVPRTRRRTRPDGRRDHLVRPDVEELESRTVFDASTGVVGPAQAATLALAVGATNTPPTLGPAFVSNVNNTAVLQQGNGSPAASLLTAGGLPTNTLSPGTPSAGSVPPAATQVAATDQAGVPGTAAPNPLSPLNGVQIEQAAAPPGTPPVAIQAWSQNLSQLNPAQTQVASSAYPIADLVFNSQPVPLLSSQAQGNSGAGNGGVAVPATGSEGGSRDDLFDALRGLSRLDDLPGFDQPVAGGQQAGSQTQAVASQNT